MTNTFYLTLALAVAIGLVVLISCKQAADTQAEKTAEKPKTETWTKPRVPDWHKNATIYEVNLRQFTEEGTFNAFRNHVPRLKEMGIDIIWFMPVTPISEKERKGVLGSPYAVADYYAVNPRFGTMDDFKGLVKFIQEQGMYAIVDWVPHHTGWDNPWITQHPEWYTRDEDGNMQDPINEEVGEPWGWTDVAELDLFNEEYRLAMIDAMAFWVKDVGVDGFRVDHAHGVPTDFWAQAADSLYKIKPLFMLGESEKPEIVNNGTFVMDYAWEMHHLLNDLAKSKGANKEDGKKLVAGNLVEGSEEEAKEVNASDIDSLLAKKDKQYNIGYQMQFTTNHDENAWAGTEFTRMGPAHQTFAVLTATFDGMPLLYTGQESAMDHRLDFFDKDPVKWGDYQYAGFYKTLFDLKHENQALWNGTHGGPLVKIETDKNEDVYAFTREKNGDKVLVMLNFSGEAQKIKLQGENVNGSYTNIFSKSDLDLQNGMETVMQPWEYIVLAQKKG